MSLPSLRVDLFCLADWSNRYRPTCRWFWIADNDVRSKLIFGSAMLLFSIAEVGVKSASDVSPKAGMLQALRVA